MRVRKPAVAGQFYPRSAEQCRAEVVAYLSAPTTPAKGAKPKVDRELKTDRLIGGIVPHAGWIFSGAIAAEVIQTLSTASQPIETVVIFGALHRVGSPLASVFASGAFETPLGEIPIDEQLAAAVVASSPLFSEEASAHKLEHSIEVQVPFVQHLLPSAKLLPILVPPVPSAPEVGRLVAEQVSKLGSKVVFIGSTDLTHYGPRYGFTPKGVGPDGLKWAKENNDQRLLDLVVALEADKIVEETRTNHNACGGGAVAATISAAVKMGANRVEILQHTTSNEVAQDRFGPAEDAVSYAGVIIGETQQP